MDDKQMFSDFKDQINRLFQEHDIRKISEEIIRFELYKLLKQSGYNDSDIKIEDTIKEINISNIDLTAANKLFEIKFQRKSEIREHNSPKTLNYGEILADLFKLSSLSKYKNYQGYVIYIFDSEMETYYAHSYTSGKKKNNDPVGIISSSERNITIDPIKINELPKTIQNAIKQKKYNESTKESFYVEIILNEKLHNEMHLIIYEIK